MKRRKMSALQRKYFGKRKTRKAIRSKPRKRVVYMARRKRSFRGYARRGAGGFKSMIAPIGAGVVDSYLDPMLPIDGVGAVAMGMFMHNSTIKDIGLYKVGFSLGNIIPLPGRGGTSQGALL